MIVRSPILLLSAAKALAARHEAQREVAARGAHAALGDDGMRFVHHAGYWSHLEPQCAESSWPFDPDDSLVNVAAACAAQKLLLARGGTGDLLLLHDRGGQPRRIGVVLAVADRVTLAPDTITCSCDVLWGNGGGGIAPTATRERSTFDSTRGDRFVAWYHAQDRRSLPLRRAA